MKSDPWLSVCRASANNKTKTLTIKHGTVLEQRELHRVVYVIRIRNDVFLMRDFCQALRSGWTSDRGECSKFGEPSKQRITLTAVIHSALSPSESARHSRRTSGFAQRLLRGTFVASSDREAVTADNHPRNNGKRVKIALLPESRIDTGV